MSLLKNWQWPVFPLLLEASLSILWCHALFLATILWALSAIYGAPLIGNSLILGHWGTITVAVALFQIFWGMRLDSSHDRTIKKLWPLAPIYPLFYWWLSALVVVATTFPTLVTKASTVSWNLRRKA
jgi:hypothetical protein